jgi:hypothetical protein
MLPTFNIAPITILQRINIRKVDGHLSHGPMAGKQRYSHQKRLERQL